MARRTKEEAQATREAILEAASMVFVEQGVAKASLEQIAKQAGVTRGAIYWHFKNKLDIVWALYEQLLTPFTEIFLQGLEDNHPHPLKQLETLLVELFRDLEVNAQKRRNLTIFFLKCDYTGELQPILNCQNNRKIEHMKIISEYFERAKQKGHLPADAESPIITLSLICFVTGLAYEYLRNPELFKLQEQAPQLIGHFFAGFSVRSTQS